MNEPKPKLNGRNLEHDNYSINVGQNRNKVRNITGLEYSVVSWRIFINKNIEEDSPAISDMSRTLNDIDSWSPFSTQKLLFGLITH